MKKYIILIGLFTLISRGFLRAQVECEQPLHAIELGDIKKIDFDPSDFGVDVWGVPEPPEDRRVFYIHGLGGQGDDEGSTGISWSQASLWSELNYKVNTARPDYADVSIDFATAELKGDLEQFDDADYNSIAIAHSQGGIVTRMVDYNYSTGGLGPEPRTFGGLVTFGSPHQGAMILNNRDDLMSWIGDACNAIAAGPEDEFLEDHFFLDLLLNETTEAAFQDFFCGLLQDQIAPYIFKDYTSGITESYMVGSPELAMLNSYTPDIPYVCFYGVETEPVMWNTLVHAIPDREPNNGITYGLAPFGANNDETLTEYAEVNTDKYYDKYLEYEDLADYYGGLAWGIDGPTIVAWFGGAILGGLLDVYHYNQAKETRDDYYNGYLWWSGANAVWRAEIGADSYAESSWSCLCDNEHEMDLTTTEYHIEPGESCDPEWGDCITVINYNLVQKESDGVVLAESAGECLGQIPPKPGYDRVMLESNHFSMRNDGNTRAKLEELFDGHHGDFFKTDPR